TLAEGISKKRPQWAGGLILKGKLAELEGNTDDAIKHYSKAVELGAVQPSVTRRLVELLSQQNKSAEIDSLTKSLRDQGAPLGEVTIVQALDAIRKGGIDRDRGIALALKAFPEDSKNHADHLTLGRIYLAAERPSEAGKAFQRAVKLGPGDPESWLNYIQYLAQTKRIKK